MARCGSQTARSFQMPRASSANNGSSIAPKTSMPQWRKLRGYAFDPVLSQQFETAGINEIVFKVPWEQLEPGPVGDYLEVIDYDPASAAFYDPDDLNEASIVGGDRVGTGGRDTLVHQRYVYVE